MSKTKDNVITRNYRGKFGDQVVFRNRYGESIMAKPPKPITIPPTEAQLGIRKMFLKAVMYAKSIHTNPVLKAKYTEKAVNGKTVFTLAIADFMKPPVIDKIDTSGYKGAIGDKIIVDATDRFEVKEVNVKITSATGDLIEEGICTKDAMNLNWVYTATVDQAVLTDVTITATAVDNPGHTGELTAILE